MGKRADLVGQRFGHLVVEASAGTKGFGSGKKAMWSCRCDCGSVVVVPTGSLRSGNSKSCGCGNYYHSPTVIDMTGERYGFLTVVDRADNYKNGAAAWICKCDCGNQIVSGRSALVDGRTKSCGCYSRSVARRRHSEYRGTDEAKSAEVGQEYAKYKRSAEVRGIEFDLTVDQFFSLCSSPCHYCGAAPSRKSTGWGNDSGIRWNGIDRVDNSLGYVLSNCAGACSVCNRAKHVISKDDFISMCHAVASRHPLHGTVNLQVADVLHGPWANRNSEASPLQWAVQ